jgi:hypothetical protein
MKSLLVVSALIEFGAGLALVVAPSGVAWLLLGSGLDTAAGVAVGRMAGAALASLGLGCWLAPPDDPRPAIGAVAAMLLYNTAVVAVLVGASLGSGLVGVALWPAVALHAALAIWCLACLWSRRDGPRS